MLSGRLAIVTGATSGIGMATAKHFVKEGAKVVGVGRNKAALAALQKETGCGVAEADITAPGACERAVAEAVSHLGGLTTLINCAGVLMPGAIGTTASLKDFEHNFSGNTRSVFEMMEHSIPHLKERSADGSCSIVNISSVNGLQSFGGVATYCAAKAAVDMLTKCAALDLAPFGIRANAVNPGLVLTELQKRGGLNAAQYAALALHKVDLKGAVLKPNMVKNGLGAPTESPEVTAQKTVDTLLTCVPKENPGIFFLSGETKKDEDNEETATLNLNAMNKYGKGKMPWHLSFSYGKALQKTAIVTWMGKDENVAAAQAALVARSKANSEATKGEYVPGSCASVGTAKNIAADNSAY